MDRKGQSTLAKCDEPEGSIHFERLLSDLSARFVALPPEQVDDEIQKALSEVLEFFRIDRCSLLRLLPCKTLWQITHNADAAGVSPYPVGSDLPLSLFPWAVERLAKQREVFSFAKLEDLPEAAAIDKESLKIWNIQSGVYIPIAALRSSEYTLGICSAEQGRNCSQEYIPRLRLLGELFVNALERCIGERALRESEERLHFAVSAADVGIWSINTSNGIMWASENLRDLLQIDSLAELNIDKFLEVVHPEDRKEVKEKILYSIEKRVQLNIEHRIICRDGSIRWIASQGNLSLKKLNLAECLMGTTYDTTERRQMEAKLEERLEEIKCLKLQLEKENIGLRKKIKVQEGFEKIVGSSDVLQYIFFKVKQVAPTDATVLILGETGTGKGMVAQTIHRMSARKDKPMITVNCAALPANLIESELFGREKGAFTGANMKQVGRFEVAQRGTIFLDEIGEMPLELQTKLLRVLQDGEFERLGSPKTIKVDVRVIASTSRNLKEEVRNNRFREDLFYRLNVFPLTMPPLRMRNSDIPQLVHHFVDKYARKIGRQIKTIPQDTLRSLQQYSWPGNVRELEHIIERAVITSEGPMLQLADHLEDHCAEVHDDSLKNLAAMEREHIVEVLNKTNWKINGAGGAASLLGLHPSTLRFRLKKLGIKRP